jgi:hypothetical protein
METGECNMVKKTPASDRAEFVSSDSTAQKPHKELTERWPQQAEIARLQRRSIVELEQMQQFHRWLDGKRLARQAWLMDNCEFPTN